RKAFRSSPRSLVLVAAPLTLRACSLIAAGSSFSVWLACLSMASIAGGRSRDGSSSVLSCSSAVVIGTYPWFPLSSRSLPLRATEAVRGFTVVVTQPLGRARQGVRRRLDQLVRGVQLLVDVAVERLHRRTGRSGVGQVAERRAGVSVPQLLAGFAVSVGQPCDFLGQRGDRIRIELAAHDRRPLRPWRPGRSSRRLWLCLASLWRCRRERGALPEMRPRMGGRSPLIPPRRATTTMRVLVERAHRMHSPRRSPTANRSRQAARSDRRDAAASCH